MRIREVITLIRLVNSAVHIKSTQSVLHTRGASYRLAKDKSGEVHQFIIGISGAPNMR
jgi:hypothetical protein